MRPIASRLQMITSLLVLVLAVAMAIPAAAQDEDVMERRKELLRAYRATRSTAARRAILSQLQQLRREEFLVREEDDEVDEPEFEEVTVVSGDTLSAIAARSGTTVEAILAANPEITDPGMIRVGQVIRIPSPGSTPPASDTASNPTSDPTPDTNPEPPADTDTDTEPPADTTAEPGSAAAAALDWSADQMPGGEGTGVNSNNNSSIAEDEHAWDSWCLAFVSTAYGREVEELRAGSAIASYEKFVEAEKIETGRTDIPAGAPVFFEATEANGQWGHIAIFTGRYDESGDPIIRTSGWYSWPGIHEISLSDMEALTGSYLGWGVID